MKKILKRIQLIHRTSDGICRKVWQNIDFNKMITLEHVWNDVNQRCVLSSLNNNYKFYCCKTKQVLPAWYHVDLLNDNDQILIDEFHESASVTKPTTQPVPIKMECLKNIPKKKQLNAFVTNRSFVITNKYSISKDFYQQWEEGKMHKNTNNCQMFF